MIILLHFTTQASTLLGYTLGQDYFGLISTYFVYYFLVSFGYSFFSPFPYYFLSSFCYSFLGYTGNFFLQSPLRSLKMEVKPLKVLNFNLPAISFLQKNYVSNADSYFYFKKSSFWYVLLPISSSSSSTQIRISWTDSGQTKFICSSFQTGLSVLVSLLFLVDKIYYPMDTLTETFISPKVLVFLFKSVVQNLKHIFSTFSSLKVALSIMKPACCLSKLRKHLKGTV